RRQRLGGGALPRRLLLRALLLGCRSLDWSRLGVGCAIVHFAEREARLDLGGRETGLLIVELVDRDARQVVGLPLLGGDESRPERVDARLERGDTRGELAGVGPRGAPRLLGAARAA